MNKKQIESRLIEVRRLKNEINNRIENIKKNNCENIDNLNEGISIVIPSFKGEKYILDCITSLINQNINPELVEIIIVLNGELDSTEKILNKVIKEKKVSNIHILHSDKKGASAARNLGVNYATKKYITFVDDDDFVSKDFLKMMYKYADDNTVVVSQIVDYKENGELIKNNAINEQITKKSGLVIDPLIDLDKVVTLNACKLFPTSVAKKLKYDETLRSGEDVVYYCEMTAKFDLNYIVVPQQDDSIYFRRLRENSISRRTMSFGFNVTERMEVISKLNTLVLLTDNSKKQIFIKRKINAQSVFINNYISSNIKERENVIKEIKKYDCIYLPYDIINRNLSNKLVVSYCFPPYVDTSGNVMAKRIREQNEVVDVVYNEMSKIRKKDTRLNRLCDDLIENRIEIASYSSFSNWNAIKQFCESAMNKIAQIESKKGQYKEIYSRAMFPASHFMAFYYKIYNSKVKWIAEFSDPLLWDIKGNMRNAEINDNDFMDKLNSMLKSKKIKSDNNNNNNNLFYLCEYIPYVFADELIFTNKNQLSYMLEKFPNEDIKKLIKKKAIIKPQPTLPFEYYNLQKSQYKIDKNKVNFAYFGSFYETRNLDDIFDALEIIQEKYTNKFTLHIFTNEVDNLKNKIKERKINKDIVVNNYVNFIEFLNLTTKFDCLIVNDAITEGFKRINPYLPSKLSDYIGSGTDVWGLCEESSVMSKYPLKYKSIINNNKETNEMVEKIIIEKLTDKKL
ncbi:glycosyltransferase [Clostridium sp. AL.422]|uniref:glycosyltransferase n=1 Tax=Clostridium TaxID=1485 RepID=UPI00293DDEE9|nr:MULTISPECIES: glycosyltransferase [unclassified Clostridium]MDV4152003.1 glycosyltransferase [Clostridium sp. AL.422]